MSSKKKIIKKIEKEMKNNFKPASSSKQDSTADIGPPRLHRDMRIICDAFRISEQTCFALRRFDAARLEDFSMMTDEDFADLVLTQARIGEQMPPLQQRKLAVLLSWAQKLPMQVDVSSSVQEQESPKAEGYELNNDTLMDENGSVNAKYKYKTSKKHTKDQGVAVPKNWESKFYEDLPGLREELRQLGSKKGRFNWANEIISFRWLFCNLG